MTEHELATITEIHPDAKNEEAQRWGNMLMDILKSTISNLAPDGNLPDTPTDAALILHILRTFRQQLAEYESLAETHLINVMESNMTHVLPTDGPTFEVKTAAKSQKWDGSGVINQLVTLGEKQGWDLDAFATAIIAAAGLDNASHSWRKTVLDTLGIDPVDYCESVPGRKKVVIS